MPPYIINIVNIKSLKYSQNSNSGDIFYKKKGKMEDIHKKFIQAWENGVTEKELCKQFNICKSTAYNWLKKYSLVKRTKERTISVHRIYQLERENQTLRAGCDFCQKCRLAKT